MPGPPPKPEHLRRRRNKPDVPTVRGVSGGEVRGPALTGRHSSLGKRFYEALRRSGQAQWYEASDWSAAELLVAAIDEFAKKPSAAMLAAVNVGMRGLLVTEADRRRARIELERRVDPVSEQDAAISSLSEYRRGVSAETRSSD